MKNWAIGNEGSKWLEKFNQSVFCLLWGFYPTPPVPKQEFSRLLTLSFLPCAHHGLNDLISTREKLHIPAKHVMVSPREGWVQHNILLPWWGGTRANGEHNSLPFSVPYDFWSSISTYITTLLCMCLLLLAGSNLFGERRQSINYK